MATMVDQIPEYHGEAKLWSSLEKFLPHDVVVYNNREINGREFDFCLFVENYGIAIIEVKGWVSSKIKVQGVDEILVDGYDKAQHSPKKQARAYRFAMLGQVHKNHNVSPLVFDLVCYPFISEAEYHDSRLDIVSEPQFTIFKEDLESGEMLSQKLQRAYDTVKNIPHTTFSHTLMQTLRREWEPNLAQAERPETKKENLYSRLCIIPGELSDQESEALAESYQSGVKYLVFCGESVTYQALVARIEQAFKKKNIQPLANGLKVGYQNGFATKDGECKTFNLEIYYVPELLRFCSSPQEIVEGRYSGEQKKILEQLAQLTTFNLQQYEVEHAPTCKNTLVEAGAGTGKTYSMVSRVAFLCNKKDLPVNNIADEIAMVTFTNDAAINMKTRLKKMFLNYFILTSDARFLKFVEDTDRAHISTIHKFALEIIRRACLYTGLGTNFSISENEYLRGKLYDKALSEFLADREEENDKFAQGLPVPVYELKKKLVGIANQLFTKSVNLSDIRRPDMGVPVENVLPYFNDLLEQVVFPSEKEYLDSLHRINRIDLKECIVLLQMILEQMGGKLKELKLRFLFVDEFQDTDDVQIKVFQKLQHLIDADCRLFVVGDLKQSIYRFRGARLSAFEQMREGSLFEWETYPLNINYRTDHRLLDIYDTIFTYMGEHDELPYQEKDRLTGNIQKETAESDLFTCIPCHSEQEEEFYHTICSVIQKQVQATNALMANRHLSKEERTIAVLVRSNWQVEKVVNAARKEGMVVRTKSGGDLFQLESTVDLYKLVLLLTNPMNPVYMVNFIESNYTDLKLDFQQYRARIDSEKIADLTRVLDEFFQARMGKTFQQVINEAYTQPILFVLKQLFETLQPWKQYSYARMQQRHYISNYEYLLEKIAKKSRVDALTLNQVVEYLQINITTGQKQLAREMDIDDEGVQIMCTTIHKSKGLEYGTVILPFTGEDIGDMRKVKLEANYIKSELSYTMRFKNGTREKNSNYNESVQGSEQIAEESRILYVALTRAIRNAVWLKDLDAKSQISWGALLEG